jgi:hypothetical protein
MYTGILGYERGVRNMVYLRSQHYEITIIKVARTLDSRISTFLREKCQSKRNLTLMHVSCMDQLFF